MTKIIVDSTLLSKLHNIKEVAELCDESGRVVGRFLPAELSDLEPQVSEEELRRREQSTEWYSTAEVLKHLENL